MNRLNAAVAAASWMCLASLAASAITLEPIAGSTPQYARPNTFFPNPIGVMVRDDAGGPLSGVPVTFSFLPGHPWVVPANVAANPADGSVILVSGPDGIAAPPEGFFAGALFGGMVLTATAPFTPEPRAEFFLQVSGRPPASVELVSGSNQIAQVGTLYREPVVVRVLDAAGLPVPLAAVEFAALDLNPGQSGGNWNGATDLIVRADASGIATAPLLRASQFAGQQFGQVNGYWMPGSGVLFYYDNLPFAIAASAELVSGPPQSVEVGHTALAPWVVRTLGFDGHPLAGVGVDFVTAPECGNFNGAARVSVLSDANGLAVSPLFTGTAAIFCPVWNETTGVSLDYSFDLTMHVFDPALVVITPSDRHVFVIEGARFTVDVAFTEWDYPIYGPPFDVQVISEKPHGASATLVGQRAPYQSNVATLEFTANDRHGDYAIVVRRGSVWTWIAVEQRKH